MSGRKSVAHCKWHQRVSGEFCLTGMIIMQGFCRGEVIRHRIMSGESDTLPRMGVGNYVTADQGGGG